MTDWPWPDDLDGVVAAPSSLAFAWASSSSSMMVLPSFVGVCPKS